MACRQEEPGANRAAAAGSERGVHSPNRAPWEARIVVDEALIRGKDVRWTVHPLTIVEIKRRMCPLSQSEFHLGGSEVHSQVSWPESLWLHGTGRRPIELSSVELDGGNALERRALTERLSGEINPHLVQVFAALHTDNTCGQPLGQTEGAEVDCGSLWRVRLRPQ